MKEWFKELNISTVSMPNLFAIYRRHECAAAL
jgi:hypothetical protein